MIIGTDKTARAARNPGNRNCIAYGYIRNLSSGWIRVNILERQKWRIYFNNRLLIAQSADYRAN